MMNPRRFNWTALLAGAAVMLWAVVGGMALHAGAFDPAPNGTGGLIYEYQTLIAGLVAAAAAGATVYVLRRQMAEERVRFERQFAIMIDPIRREIERESSNLLQPTQRLLKAIDAMATDSGNAPEDLRRHRADIQKRKKMSFERLRERMSAHQAIAASSFFKVLDTSFVDGPNGIVLPPLDDATLSLLRVHAEQFVEVLSEMSEAAEALAGSN